MIVVDKNSENSRLDNYLIRNFQKPRSLICKMIRTGQVRINSKRAKISDKVMTSDIIRVPDFLSKIDKVYKINPRHVEMLESWKIYETEDFFAINKPSGIASQGGVGIVIHIAMLIESIEDAYIVHRLDKETSGVMIIAKNRQAAVWISDRFKKRDVSKYYLAAVEGKAPEEKYIDLSLTKKGNVVVDEDGKNAITHLKLVEYSQKEDISIVLLKPETGRTHQLRVHCAEIGYPIVGDKIYGNESRETPMCLHNCRMSFSDPSGVLHDIICY
jgi:23S rRNA pseudouridine955/2504/2580 synthase